jgi:hypothetical protein
MFLDIDTFDALISAYRHKRKMFSVMGESWLLEAGKIDCLQRLRYSLIGSFFNPDFYTLEEDETLDYATEFDEYNPRMLVG